MIGDVVEVLSRRLGLQHGNSVGRAVFLLKGQACRGVVPNEDLPDQKCQRLHMASVHLSCWNVWIEQPLLTSTIHTQCLCLFGTSCEWVIVVMSRTAFPLGDWKRPAGHAWITWMKTVVEDLKSYNLWHWLKQSTWLRTSRSGGCWLLVNMAEKQPVWRLLAASQHGSEPATLEAPGSVHS